MLPGLVYLKKLPTKQLGKHYKKIDQWFASSKTCHCCGETVDTLALDIRRWQCQHCQVEHDRDINAAMNIKKQGLILLKAEGLSVSAN
jgi:putative transposase